MLYRRWSIVSIIRTVMHTVYGTVCMYRPAIYLWLGWRIAMFLLPFWSGALFPASTLPSEQPPLPAAGNVFLERGARTWLRYDSGFYMTIATSGYTEPPQAAFYPLFPLAIRGLAFVTGLHHLGINGFHIAAHLIVNSAALVSICLLYELVTSEASPDVARRSILYVLIYPVSFFLAAIYTESLFIAVALGALRCSRHQRWGWSAGLAALAVLCRNQGVMVVLMIGIEYGQQNGWTWSAWKQSGARWMVLPIGAFLGWLFNNAILFDNPFAFLQSQTLWERESSTPWQTIGQAFRLFSTDPRFRVWPHTADHYTRLIIDLPLTIGCGLLVSMVVIEAFWKRTWSQSVYVLGCFSLPLWTMKTADPLMSMPRYTLILFPIFVLLARLGLRYPWVHYAYLVGSSMLLGILLTRFVLYFFVA